MQKITNLLKIVWCFLILLSVNAGAQVYVHDFGTTPISTHPYTAAPVTIDSHLTGSSWSNSKGSWVSYNGSAGEALGMANTSGTPTVTLTFNVQPGYQLQVNSFSFWRMRSPSGAQNWSMTINGIPVGSGTIPQNTGASTGTLAVSQPVSGLTGTVNVVLTLSGASGTGTFRIDDFTLNGSVTSSCVSPTITTMFPATGPFNTVVTLNGSGFQNGTGTSAVTFNGSPAAGFTVVSDNVIKAVVPATATTGPISVITNGCAGNTGTFTVINGNCPANTLPSDLYISEIYDQNSGSGGMIELYNASGSTITFNGQYVLQRYGNVNDSSPTAGYILPLTGTLPAEGVLLVGSSATGSAQCAVPTPSGTNSWGGINDNDKIELLKNGTRIDVVNTPASQPGFTMIRKPDAIAPSATFVESDWNITLHPVPTPTPNTYCSDLGNHTVTPGDAREITAQPFSQSVCENETATYSLTINNESGFTYQWKVLNNSGNWVNISDNQNYSGTNSATLVINDTPLSFLGNQYYCVISNGTCVLVSNAVQLTVSPLPVVALTITQPTCTTPTGSVTIVPSVGDALTYSTDGTNYSTSATLTGLASGNYQLYVKSGSNCTSITPFTIAPLTGTPDPAVATVTQPTCATATGSIQITSPLGADLTYSIDGTNFQAGTTFSNLASGNYTITVQTVDGCTSTSSVTINDAPATPAVPQATVLQPTCLTAGTITVTAPLGTGLTYSIGGAFQSTPIFTGVASGNYTLTVRNGDNCTNTTTVTIDPVPSAPLAATVTVTQPTCAQPTGSITVSGPLGLGLTYSLNGTTFQDSPVFSNLTPGTYVVTTLNLLGCTSVSSTITINPASGAPAVPAYTVTQPTCSASTGSITITNAEAGVTYTLSGVGAPQTGTTFSGLAAGTYTITADNGAGCTSTTGNITITAPSGSPAVATFTTTQPTCTTATGSIAITNAEAGVTYTLSGVGTPQTGTTFTGLAAGNYTITADNGAGCTSTTGTIIINAAPAAPAVATFTTTQPTCSASTGSITITNAEAGVTYTLSGVGTPQTGTTFSGLAAGTYTITADNGAGCTSTTGNITITAPSGSPAVATFTTTQPTCTTATGSIAITNAEAGVTYTLSGVGAPQTGTTFTGLAAGNYTITADNGAGCTSTTGTITINAAPAAPAVATFTTTQPTCSASTGSITITNAEAGVTYTLSGVGTPQTGTTFSGLAAGTYTITADNGAGCTSTTGNITITAPSGSPAVATFTTTQPTCTTATGSIAITNAEAGVTYTLSGVGTPQTGTTFTGLAAGNYTITADNGAGCTSTTGTITINAAPAAPAVATFTTTQPTCSASTGSITITNAEAGVTYTLSGVGTPQTGTTFSGLAAGTYTITADNGAGCTSTTGTITINNVAGAPAVATFTTTQPTCTTTTGSITITNASILATYTLNGPGGAQTGTTFTGLAPGNYTITADNGAGCTSTTGTITINAVPTAPAVATFTTTQPTCSASTGSITITNAEAGVTYTLSGVGTPQTGTTFTGLASGNYTITADNGAGCTSTTGTITINTVAGAPDVATYTVNQPTCTNAQGSIVVSAPTGTGFTYSLNGGTAQSGTTFAGLSAGTYTITVDNGSGCTSTTGTITINGAPTAPAVATYTITQPTCAAPQGAISITAPEAGVTYTLNGVGAPQTGTSFTGLASGSYTITADNGGCTAVTGTITIDPLPAGPSTPVVTVYHPNCGETTGSITVDAPVGGVQYSIDGVNFVSTAIFPGLAPGTYTITVRDNNTLCTTASAAIMVDSPIAPPVITSTQGCQETVDGRQYLIVTSPVDASFDPATATYEWRNATGQLIGGDSTLNLSQYVAMNGVQMDGTVYQISLKVTVPGGCSVTANYDFNSVFCNIPKGISPNGDAKNDRFDLTGFNARKVSIFNRYGREVYSRSNYVNEWEGQSDSGDELPTGTYYYIVETANRTETGWVYINREE